MNHLRFNAAARRASQDQLVPQVRLLLIIKYDVFSIAVSFVRSNYNADVLDITATYSVVFIQRFNLSDNYCI